MNSRTDYKPQNPITDPVDLKYLGKLSEELGEGVQAISRCIIQGINERNEKENCSNKDCMQNELADILCNIELVTDRFDLDTDAMKARMANKSPKLKIWHCMV